MIKMWQNLNPEDVIIGKNAIENLTEGMYKNPLIIYREYIQNAADGIDEAKSAGIYKPGEKPEIDIDVDPEKRFIRISDNGIGVKNADWHSLINIADSEKDREVNKGFRGIGRLGGLAYCTTLRFITSHIGESVKTIIEWNAKQLMQLINDRSVKMTSAEIIAQVVRVSEDIEDSNKHYFIVELEGIKESKRKDTESTSDLVNLERVKNYIAQTAPVDYDTGFLQFSNKILKFSSENQLPLITYNVNVDGSAIFKNYRKALYYIGEEKKKVVYDELADIRFHTFYSANGEVLAWLWYGISQFAKKIPENANSDIRGILLRKDNIQIGEGSNTIAHLHKEKYRGNDYFVGELHAVHPNLIPNSRRDYFIENDTLEELEEVVSEFFKEKLYSLYQTASDARGYYTAVETVVKLQTELDEKSAGQEFVSGKEIEAIQEKLDVAKKNAEKKEKKLSKKIQNSDLDPEIKLTIDLNKKSHLKKVDEIKKGQQKNLAKKGETTPSVSADSQDNKKTDIPVLPSDKQESQKPKDDAGEGSETCTISSKLINLTKKERKIVDCVYSVIYDVLPNEDCKSLINKIQAELLKL